MDKPAGPSSHDIVNRVRRLAGVRRVGHAGTLDPFATGLLPVLVGRATRLATFLVGLDKTYEGVIVLGQHTDTDDATGTVIAESPVSASAEALASAMAALTGTIAQVPPAYSAKKVAGRPAYRAARRGQAVSLASRDVVVHDFALIARDGATLRFTARVGSGTYVRALARDLGEALGCGGHLSALRRTGVGPWSVADAVSLPLEEEGRLDLRAPMDALPHLPRRELTGAEAAAVRHGRPVPNGHEDGPIALVADGVLLAVAVRAGDELRPTVVLAA